MWWRRRERGARGKKSLAKLIPGFGEERGRGKKGARGKGRYGT